MSEGSPLPVRLLRRLGRFAIAMLATLAFFVGGVAAWMLMALTGHVFVYVCFAAASASAIGVFLLFDRLNLLPDDPAEKPTELSLRE